MSITKVGAGDWALSGTSYLTADVLVQQGTLTLSGALTNDGHFEAENGRIFVPSGGIMG